MKIDSDDLRLWYKKPALSWKEGLPLGNGHVGAMLDGGVNRETINLSESTCFSGEASLKNNQSGAPEVFRKMRKAVEEGDFATAKQLSDGFIGIRHNFGTNLPLGNLIIELEENPENYCLYKRSLSISSSLAELEYKVEDTTYHRTVFLSNPHRVLVVKLAADKSGKINVCLSLDGGDNSYSVEIDSRLDFLLYGKASEKIHSDGKAGVNFHGRMRILHKNGEVKIKQGKLCAENCDEVVILTSLATNFDGTDEVQTCFDQVEAAAAIGFETLLDIHVKDYKTIFDRVTLKLVGDNNYDRPTDEWLKEIKNGAEDPALTALMFQYGRYLLISSSRESSQLPAHLQGVWNDYVACRIGWSCDMHLDINTQMNYWPIEVANITECGDPLFKWIRDKLVPSGRITAREAYGLDGWVAELVSNAWGYAAPYWHSNISPCPTGGVWVATHLWEHYKFTQDKTFLEQYAYPVIEESVRFFIEYIFEDLETGYLIGGPSISPENIFEVNGKEYSFSNGCTYENIMIREIFNIYIDASYELGHDSVLLERVKAGVNRLLPYQLDKEGLIKEWMHDYKAVDKQHRHTSHLLGVYPFSQITPDKTPQLIPAVSKSLEDKLTPEESWEDTGWARSMLMLYAARLREGAAANEHILSMQRKLTNQNLMVKHPPTRGAGSFDDVYELDGNTGLTACVAEMLIQSHDNEIHLLPALPAAWSSGYVTGLCARGGYTVDIYWEEGKLIKANITSKKASSCKVRYNGQSTYLQVKPNIQYTIEEHLKL